MIPRRSFNFILQNVTLFRKQGNVGILNSTKLVLFIKYAMGSSNCKSFSPTKAAASCASGVKGTKMSDTSDTEPMSEPADEYIEEVVCHENDIQENEMKTFNMGEEKVLVVKQNGLISALGSKCTHSNAPLVTGVLGLGRVRCPWHGACFNLNTGDIEDFPGLDALPSFKVVVESGNVKVRARKCELKASKVPKPFPCNLNLTKYTFVVIGGGPSASMCVETLRKEGFTGKLHLICKENYLPYDRIKLSKQMNSEIEKLQFRNADFYKERQINVLTGVEATSFNAIDKWVTLSDGETINFTKCYIATGSSARQPTFIPGGDLQNIFTLRTFDDMADIYSRLKPEAHVVVLGSSFIGLEAAACCVGKVAKITVVGHETAPLVKVLGKAVGTRLQELFEEKGVEFKMNCGVKKFIGVEGNLASVELTDASILRSHICIAGIGTTQNTEFLEGSGIDLEEETGSIEVNKFMQTNIPSVYAGGDVALAPLYPDHSVTAAIGHIGLASYHGRIAALNMVGKPTEIKAVPFFWMMVFGKSIRYCGYGMPDDRLVEGDLSELKFVVFYFKDNKVCAVASCNRDPIVAKFAELTYQGKTLLRNDIIKDPFGWANKYRP